MCFLHTQDNRQSPNKDPDVPSLKFSQLFLWCFLYTKDDARVLHPHGPKDMLYSEADESPIWLGQPLLHREYWACGWT